MTKQRKTFSVFLPFCEKGSGRRLDTGEPIPKEVEENRKLEAVYYKGDDPETAVPIAAYVVVDGKRVAKRINRQWVSLVPNVSVHFMDDIDTSRSH
jgi:hypothetical protein